MTYGIRRFIGGQPVEVQRRTRTATGVDVTWEKGYVFSHYDKNGKPVVTSEAGNHLHLDDPTLIR